MTEDTEFVEAACAFTRLVTSECATASPHSAIDPPATAMIAAAKLARAMTENAAASALQQRFSLSRAEMHVLTILVGASECAEVGDLIEGLSARRGCVIQSMAITETGPSRSPKPVDGDHRKRFIAIGGPADSAVIT